jgi:hypothetical protein
MMLGGQTVGRRGLEARLGRLEQLGGLRRFRLVEGREDGVELIQVRTGAGLTYYVSPSRALDISLAEFAGMPLSWQSAGGDVHPAYYDERGAEWLRTAAGGLLMTCGLSYVGAPGEDEGRAFGLHGRIHHLPARQVSATGSWHGDNYEMVVSGVVEETAMFGEHLRLRRTIRSRLGTNRIQIDDVVENAGFSPTPLMILYHFNFGYPLLTEQTRINFPSQRIVARDEGTPLEGFDRWQTPQPDYRERVYYHQELGSDEATVTIRNPAFPVLGDQSVPLKVELTWLTSQLPRLVQWKMPGEGLHVLGIEPANCHVEGRAAERARGTLETLGAGESRSFQLGLEVAIDG